MFCFGTHQWMRVISITIAGSAAMKKERGVSQSGAVDRVAARGRKEYTLDGGPYRSRYTRNGR